MKVIVREGHEINLASVEIWVKAGSINETADNNGVSHFIEHMIFKSTSKYGPGQIDREMEGLGAELNGGTSKDWVHFYTTVASEYLPKALDVFADAIMNPQFKPEEMQKERQVVLDEIARAGSNPARSAATLFAQTAFTAHPYRFIATGTRDSVNKLTRDDLTSYYNRYYTPSNMCVVIAGDVPKDKAVDMVQTAFSGFDRKSYDAPAVPVEPPLTSPRIRHFDSQTDQPRIVFGYYAPPVSEFRDSCTIDVVMAILGSTNQGRISASLNAQGIRFNKITTDYMTQRDTATTSVLVSASPQDTDAITAVVQSEFKRLATEAVSPAELAQAVRMAAGSDLYDQETFAGQARILGLYESIGSYDYALKYNSTVRSITALDIMSVARKYFGDNYILATIGMEQAKQQ